MCLTHITSKRGLKKCAGFSKTKMLSPELRTKHFEIFIRHYMRVTLSRKPIVLQEMLLTNHETPCVEQVCIVEE